ncbi:MAG: hypothetical protein D6790_10500, partial [Caldilineae bacterium]
MVLGELHVFQPYLLARGRDQVATGFPVLLAGPAELMVAFLAQGIVPSPALDQLDEQGRAELAVAHHLHLGPCGHQAAHVGQESALDPGL